MPDSERLTGDVTVDDGVFLYVKIFFYTSRYGDAIAAGSDIADAVWYFVAHAKNTTGAELAVDCGNMIQLYPVIPR